MLPYTPSPPSPMSRSSHQSNSVSVSLKTSMLAPMSYAFAVRSLRASFSRWQKKVVKRERAQAARSRVAGAGTEKSGSGARSRPRPYDASLLSALYAPAARWRRRMMRMPLSRADDFAPGGARRDARVDYAAMA